MNSLFARRNLRFLMGFTVFILLLIPLFLLNSVNSNILDLIPFQVYTEKEIQYDQDGRLISATTIRETGNEIVLKYLNELSESRGRDVIIPEIKNCRHEEIQQQVSLKGVYRKNTVTKIWDCR